ncbi:MAG: putative rane protein [Herbinix sp.]|jgi:leader peptidase (prepilin peptidase)/N-methyltransferase|nr:putative rane protein [Herbinix sp.]
MAEVFTNMIMGVLLLLCGVQDFFKRKIFIWMIGVGAILIGVCLPFNDAISIPERIGGVAIGACIIAISKVTGGKIGMGDGFLLCVTGLGLGFWGNLELFGVALFFAALVSIVLLMFRLADRKKSIPFVPFLLMGYVFLIIANKGISF